MLQRSPLLAQPYLSGVGGEEEHDGEARQQASVLDGKCDEEAAATRVLLLTTHLVHFRKLRSTKQSRSIFLNCFVFCFFKYTAYALLFVCTVKLCVKKCKINKGVITLTQMLKLASTRAS